ESNLKAAISLMAGHIGNDMSTPMQERHPVSEEQKEHTMKDKSHNMEEMESMNKSEKSVGPKAVPSQRRQLYTCTMHPEVISEKPGDCPKCGMKLGSKRGPE